MAKRKSRQKTKQDKYERRIKEEHLWDKIFLLHIKKSLYVIIIWVLSIIIHEAILRFTVVDEPFFTAIAIYIIPAYLLISVIHTLSKHKRVEGK